MPSPSLILLGIIDLIAGLIVVSIPQHTYIEVVSYQIPYLVAFYIGIALVVKGVYSLFFALR